MLEKNLDFSENPHSEKQLGSSSDDEIPLSSWKSNLQAERSPNSDSIISRHAQKIITENITLLNEIGKTVSIFASLKISTHDNIVLT